MRRYKKFAPVPECPPFGGLPDFRKKAVLPMRSQRTSKIEFDVVVYGVEPVDLLTVPNPIIASLAAKYPDHFCTIWEVKEF